MGIDLATWRARIGLNYYHMCHPLQTRWRNYGGRLYQSGVASWGVGEVMSDTPLVLKSCMTIVALSLILQYVVHLWPKLKGRGGGGGGKVRCHLQGFTSQVRGTVDNLGTLLLRAIVVVIPLLLVIAGDVERNPGPEVSSLKVLLDALHPARASWYNIGLQLDIPHTTLDCFKQNSSDQSDLMREMLKHWLKTAVDPRPTWEVVVIALRSCSVDERYVAEQLELKYCTQHKKDESNTISKYMSLSEEPHDQVTVGSQLEDQAGQCNTCSPPDLESPTTSSAGKNSRTSPLLSEGSHKPPFGCECGNCTLSSFIERGCPNPISSENTFPYLDLSGLTDEKKEELKERLWFESREIMIKFQNLVSTAIESLIERDISLTRLVAHVTALGAFDPVFKESKDIPLLQDRIKELKTAESIPVVFLILQDYYSFFNYDIIEHITEVLGTKKDKAKLQEYKDNFDQYARRRIYECAPRFGPESETDHPNIFLKLDSRYDKYTVAEIKGFCHRMSEILHVSSKGVLRLCRLEKGCIQLTLQVPQFVQQKIFPLSREQEKILEAEGVTELTCGEYQWPRLAHHEIDASEVYEQTTTSSDETKFNNQRKRSHAGSTLVVQSPTNVARHSNSTSPPHSESLEPLQWKPQVHNDTEPEVSSTSSAPIEGTQKPFGCRCGKCTFFSFILKRCPKPTPTASSFPLLDFDRLTDEQQQELKDRFWSESRNILMQFRELVSATMKSLTRQNISPDDLKSHVIYLRSFNPVRKTKKLEILVPFLTKPKIVDTIGKFFLVLDDYFSFFNYDVIEHIIKILGTEDDKARLQRYHDDFIQYAKRRIFECLPRSDTAPSTVFVKLDSHYDEYTDEEIKRFCHRLSDIFDLSTFCCPAK